jgi:O-succinylbenzoic acid--CoA ligase
MVNNCINIQIQDKIFTVDELKHFCVQKINNTKTPIWEKDIFLFIEEWFSTSDTITVNTSGSTGTPKKIQLQKTHMSASAKATLSFFDLKKGDQMWLCLPVKYIAGKMMIVRSFVGNLNLIYSEPTSTPTHKVEQKISFSAMVPNQVFNLLNSQKGINQLQNINKLLIGGSSISSELENKLLNTLSISCWHSYGMTETITHIALRNLSSDTENRIFLPLNGINLKTNFNSQLIIDAPAIGVKNLVTNDVVKLNKDKSFIIIGRVDNVIISGGIKLHPETIESKINKLITNNFFIGGIPDSILGEKLILFIEGNSDNNQLNDLLNNKFEGNLLKYEIPKTIIYLKEFLRTKNGKLKRKSMTNNYIEGLS